MTPSLRNLLTLAATIVALHGSAIGQVIRLHKEAAIDAGQDVRLGDIATVTGTDRNTAEALANTVLLSQVETTRTLKAETLLLALISQHGGAAIGPNLQVAGSASCLLRVGENDKPEAPAKPTAQELPVQPAPVESTKGVTPAPAAQAPTTTAATAPDDSSLLPAGIIQARVQKELNLPADKIRITLETINPQLDQPIRGKQKWTCRPLTRTFVGTAQFEAILVEGPRTLAKITVQVHIERKQPVVCVTKPLPKGAVLTADDVQDQEMWLDRALPNLLPQSQTILGMESVRPLGIGVMLELKDFRPAILAARNDQLTILYRTGTMEVKMLARAMEEGKLNDQIQVRTEGSGEMYQAILIGKRLAVVGTQTPSHTQETR